ncbi:hypothetical protein QT974_26195 [Microcoleus sp. herbarium12]
MEEFDRFRGHKTAVPDYLINFYDKLSIISHKKCRQHFHCADGGKLYTISGQFVLKKCSIVLTSFLGWMRTRLRNDRAILLSFEGTSQDAGD